VISEFRADRLTVNMVVAVRSPDTAGLPALLADLRTEFMEAVEVIDFPKSDGVVGMDAQFAKLTRDNTIKEYFFGHTKQTLSPSTQSVSFDDVAIFKVPDGTYRP